MYSCCFYSRSAPDLDRSCLDRLPGATIHNLYARTIQSMSKPIFIYDRCCNYEQTLQENDK